MCCNACTAGIKKFNKRTDYVHEGLREVQHISNQVTSPGIKWNHIGISTLQNVESKIVLSPYLQNLLFIYYKSHDALILIW